MSNETSNESNAEGEEVDKPVTEAEKVSRDTEELKAKNDAYDVEKLRAEKARAERQRGGESNAGQEAEKPKEETPKEYSDRVMKNEVKPE